jgi:hypothetical protein
MFKRFYETHFLIAELHHSLQLTADQFNACVWPTDCSFPFPQYIIHFLLKEGLSEMLQQGYWTSSVVYKI